jgi:hypothetical protein
MLQFDTVITSEINKLGGFYRRYCDDIICIIPTKAAGDINDIVQQGIAILKLEIHPDKSSTYYFSNGLIEKGTSPLVQYLGLTFDGTHITIRAGSISRYYSKLRAAVSLAHQTRKKHDRLHGVKTAIRRKKINLKYSYIGRHNFIAYALKAFRLTQSHAIKRQIKGHWAKLQREIAKVEVTS